MTTASQSRYNLPWFASFLILLTVALIPNPAGAAGRTSLGIVGGAGLPVGWWSDRWDPFQSGEVNLRYEFQPGIGLLFITGLNKAYLKQMSAATILAESGIHIEPELKDYTTILGASQGGFFKHVSTGFGVYAERAVSGYRAYGSLAMVIYHWKFERTQYLVVEIAPPVEGSQPRQRSDIWSDSQISSDIGAQMSVGIVRPIKPGLLVDISAAYNMVNIGAKNGALAFWGYPIRTASPLQQSRLSGSKGNVDFFQLRIGVRYGR